MAKALSYMRLRAPRNDGETLLVPGWNECLAMPALNRTLMAEYDFSVLGKAFSQLRSDVRRDVVSRATEYTSAYADVAKLDSADRPIIMSGHQPQLFHPGVWAKNFLIDRLASDVNGIAVQMIIDNDTQRGHTIRVPGGTVEDPTVATQPFDAFEEPLPFEMRFVRDMSVLESFPERVQASVSGLISEPLVTQLWPNVLSAISRGRPLGHAFAEARHKLELDVGLRTIELPISELCSSAGFVRFAAHLLTHGVRLHEVYNSRLHEYRLVHKLRSDAQPMPDLRRDGDWFEAPFWFWSVARPERRALWWKRNGADLEVGSPNESWTLRKFMRSPEDALEQLSRLDDDVFRLRPRALTNTMFLRMFASDCFVHGIGGAKYDQITDLIISDFFGVKPPELIASSQTTWLPVDADLVSDEVLAENRQILRQMYFHPEKFLEPEAVSDNQVSSSIANKQKWVVAELPRGERLERHREIAAANVTLRRYLLKKAEKQTENLTQLELKASSTRLLSSREWSFCLFPLQFLTNRLLDLNFTDS